MKRPSVALRRGYTLIELMIVVAIMGILAAIALPRYQNYQLKSKMAEPLSDLEAAKVAVTEAYGAGNNAFPATASPPIPVSAPSNAKYVSAVAYNSTVPNTASVVLTLGGTNNPNVDGKLIGIFGTGESDGTVSWICGTAQASTDTSAQAQTALYAYIPVTCQN